MKFLYLTVFIFLNVTLLAQVGINTENPQSSLDIQKNQQTSHPDGLLLPRVSVEELNLKEKYYGEAQNGTLVYVTDIIGASGKTSKITSSGFYYYNNDLSQ